jgi:uncharacterized protein
MTLTGLSAKQAALAKWLSARGSVLVGFSGGVDSALLAVTATDVLGAPNVLAVLGVSASLASNVHDRAAQLARQFGLRFREIETHELDDTNYTANRGDRCFHCKRELWNRLLPIAREEGMNVVVDGTIADDLSEHRPGMAAGTSAGVESPLAACGFTKADVRAAARERGIPIWDAPAAPCLSSRVVSGVEVTPDRLAVIDRAEAGLRALGIEGDFRVRHLGTAARVELPVDSMSRWSGPAERAAVAAVVHGAGFDRVLLDSRGYRRGALQERGITEVTDITVTGAGGSPDTSV